MRFIIKYRKCLVNIKKCEKYYKGVGILKLSKVEIKNYRRFLDASIDFEASNFAILAGANNSGKTSLIQLLCKVFNNKGCIKENDLSLQRRNEILNEVMNELDRNQLSEEEFPSKLLLKVKQLLLKNYSISVKITVKYREEETITLFSNYLMDLDENKKEFYFQYRCNPKFSIFSEKYPSVNASLFKLHSEKIKKRQEIDKLRKEPKNDEKEINILEAELDSINFQFSKVFFKLFGESLKDEYYYCNSDFKICNRIDYQEFSRLFVFDYITADRELDNENGNKKKITSAVIESTDPLTEDSTWKSEFYELFLHIKEELDGANIDKRLREKTLDAFKLIKDNIDLVGETHIDSIEALMNFDEKLLLKLIKDSIAVNYVFQDSDSKFYLGEDSQGLGISNLIYISLQLMTYQKELNSTTVNFFVIEEPEAHMHIQMQKVLLDYLNDIFNDDKNIQGLISTHSNEIVKNSPLVSLKVIRPSNPFQNKIFDLSDFLDKHNNEKTFFETFFKLNFSNMVFCDKAIVFEGDTERMYIESLLANRKSFRLLSKKYISFCQCGGAYAHIYRDLIKDLEITACIFTDMDYSKSTNCFEDLSDDNTTNTTLNTLIPRDFKTEKDGKTEITISNIYKWQMNERQRESFLEVFTQRESDGYARTLEEAILYQYIVTHKEKYPELENYLTTDFNVFSQLPLLFWKSLKEKGSLNIIIPNAKREKDALKEQYKSDSNKVEQELKEFEKNKKEVVKRSIRDIVHSLSNSKSDFMYSIILNNLQEKVIPDYIKGGLLWLETTCSL